MEVLETKEFEIDGVGECRIQRIEGFKEIKEFYADAMDYGELELSDWLKLKDFNSKFPDAHWYYLVNYQYGSLDVHFAYDQESKRFLVFADTQVAECYEDEPKADDLTHAVKRVLSAE